MRQSKTWTLLRAAILSLLMVASPSFSVWGAPEAQAAAFEIGREDFFVPGIAPVRQSGPYDVTIVYFMDYQCPACRKHTPDVARALKEEQRVRVIYRDTPIFGPRSTAAARAAIASQFQGKHAAMHHALMTSDMPLDEASLRAAADKAGVDWARLQRDLEARGDEIDRLIAWNMQLSEAAEIAGTPAFVVGDTLADGALDYDGLKAEIADARAEAGTPTPTKPEAAETEAPASGTATVEVAAPRQEAAEADAPKPPVFEQAEAPATAEEAVAAGSADDSAAPVWPWIAGLAAALLGIVWFARSRAS